MGFYKKKVRGKGVWWGAAAPTTSPPQVLATRKRDRECGTRQSKNRDTGRTDADTHRTYATTADADAQPRRGHWQSHDRRRDSRNRSKRGATLTQNLRESARCSVNGRKLTNHVNSELYDLTIFPNS